MAQRYTDEFRRDAVRMATTRGLTTAQQLIRSIDERGGPSFHRIWVLGFRR
ncbi:MAG: transposase-like protein [Paracoccaceae bacterium]|jgi:transposase-like protein